MLERALFSLREVPLNMSSIRVGVSSQMSVLCVPQGRTDESIEIVRFAQCTLGIGWKNSILK